jgi:hypothetical protein
VTNAPQELLSTNVVGTIYKVRWQIELVFKLAKSDAKLEQTKGQKAERVICELYAKLIGLLLFERMLALLPLPQPENLCQERTISYPKAWQRLKDKVMALGKTMKIRRNFNHVKRSQSLVDSEVSKLLVAA